MLAEERFALILEQLNEQRTVTVQQLCEALHTSESTIREWPSFNAMLEGYYAEKDRAERLRTKSKELHKAVHNMYDRALRKQAARQAHQESVMHADQDQSNQGSLRL